MRRLAVVLAAVWAVSFGPASAAGVEASLEQCAYVGGPAADAFVSVSVCNGPSASGSDLSGPLTNGHACISVESGDVSYSGCDHEPEMSALVVNPVLGTATISVVVAAEEDPTVTMHVNVTMLATGPAVPAAFLGDDVETEHGRAAYSAFGSMGAEWSGITMPGSTVTTSNGRGGEIAVGSGGGFGWRVATQAAAGTTDLSP